MPSRKLADRCPRCGCKNHLRAKFCNDCGLKLNESRAPKDSMGRAKLHADVAHPINAGCRERIQAAVVKAYEAEVERSKSPDYKPPVYDDFGDEDVSHLVEEQMRTPAAPVDSPPPSPRTPIEEPPVEEPPAEAEPAAAMEGRDEEGHFSDYNSLIADLKREAAGRQGRPDRPESPFTQIPRPAPAPRPERGNERGGREGGRPGQGENRGGRGGERQGRDDRGQRRFDRRDDRRGGPPRDDRRRDQPRRSESPPEASPPAPAPMKAPPPPQPAPSPPPSGEDDFGAGL